MRNFVVRSATTQAPLLLLVALLVAAACVGAGTASAGLRTTADVMFERTLADAPDTAREVTVTFGRVRRPSPAAAEVGPDLVERTGRLEPLLGAPRPATLGPNLLVDAVNDRVPPGSVSLTPTAFTDLDALVDITRGRAPGPTEVIELPPAVAAAYDYETSQAPLVEIALVPEAAKELDLPVGTYVVPDSLETDVVGLAEIPVMRVVGLYEPRSDTRSALDDVAFTRAPGIGFTSDELRLDAAALVADPAVVADGWPGRSTVQWTLPVVEAPPAADAESVAGAVTRLSLTQWPFQDQGVTVVAGTSLGDVAQQFADRRATSDALVLLPLSGLLVAGLVAVALAARLLARRRARDTRTVYARGASVTQVAASRVAEAVAVSAPGAVLGLVAAHALAGDAASGGATRADAVVVVLTALGAVTTMTVAGLLRPGDDSGRTRRRAVAQAGEGVVAVLAVAGAGLLLSRGDLQQADPVLLLVPVLVAAAGTFAMLRLVRVGLRAGQRLSRLSSGLVSLLGPTRAIDSARASVLPSLAVVLAVSVAVLTVAVTDSVARGVSDSGWQTTGADVQVRGNGFDPETVAAVADLSGVDAVAPVHVLETAELSDRTGRLPTGAVIAADRTRLRAATAGTPVDLLPPGGRQLRARAGTGIVPRDGTVALEYGTAELAVDLVGAGSTFPGFGWAGEDVVLMDLRALDRAVERELPDPSTLLLAGTPDPAELRTIVEADDPDAVVTTRAAAVETQAGAPLTSRTTAIFAVATAAAVGLALLGVLFSVAFGAPGRRRAGRTLRALGASRRQSMAVAAAELVPTVLVTAVVGGLCGALVAWLAGSALDLRLLTGQTLRAAVRPDLGSALQIGGLTVLVAGATIAAALVASAARGAVPVSDEAMEEES